MTLSSKVWELCRFVFKDFICMSISVFFLKVLFGALMFVMTTQTFSWIFWGFSFLLDLILSQLQVFA